MRSRNVCIATQAISYIEENLKDSLRLNQVAEALHYSKYHLHRIFKETVGLTIHEYIKRRQLTEAARLLAYSQKTILEIALVSGYESQQAFTDVFRAVYKITPARFREAGRFYPLQLRICLGDEPRKRKFTERDIVHAEPLDVSHWMELVRLKIDGYPCLDETEYIENLRCHMDHGRALIIRDGDTAAGVMAFSETDGAEKGLESRAKRTENAGYGSIDFLAVHPQYRTFGIEELFLRKLTKELLCGREIGVTTYRAGDRADTGYRREYRRLGFKERELLIEYGYPTQRFVLPPN